MIADTNDCGVTMHSIAHQFVWNTRHECLRHETSHANVAFTRHLELHPGLCASLVHSMYHLCFIDATLVLQLLSILDVYFFYKRSLSLPLESLVSKHNHTSLTAGNAGSRSRARHLPAQAACQHNFEA